MRRPRRSPLFPSPTLFRSRVWLQAAAAVLLVACGVAAGRATAAAAPAAALASSDSAPVFQTVADARAAAARSQNVYQASLDRKSTRLNSSHLVISYAVFCL